MFNLNALIHLREGNRLEAKEAAGGTPKSAWETYSAFANTNGGVILLGVSEDRAHNLTATGVRNPEQMVKNLWDTLNNRNKVSANVLNEEDITIEHVDDATIIVIDVPRANRESKPVYIDRNPIGGTYRRNGEGDYQCSEEEYRAMIRDNGTGATTIDNMPLERFDDSVLDDETIRAYRNSLSAVRPGHPWLSLDNNEFLLRLGATAKSEDGKVHPSRAGLLMFGHEWSITQEFPYYFLDYRETGESARRWDHRTVSGDGEWSGNLYDFWLRVWPRLSSTISRPFTLDSSLRRMDDTPLHMALREALANTLIHADYYLRGNTVIIHEPHHITFANPGGLRMPADVAMAGGLSDSRNPTLLKMFALVSIAERAGSGFDAMRAGCDWARIPHPQLTETFNPDRTRLTIDLVSSESSPQQNGIRAATTDWKSGAPVNSTAATAIGAADDVSANAATTRTHPPHNHTDVAAAVLEYLNEHGTITRSQIEQLTGVSASKAKSQLRQLISVQRIQRHGVGRGTYYTLPN